MKATNLHAAASIRRGIALVLALAAATALGGCGLFERTSDFDRVAEERPLEIPPDLDRPRQSSSMAVPNTPGGDSTAPRSVGNTLAVDDSVASTYRRMGLALERSGFEVSSRTESANEIVVEYTDEVAREERPGLFSRWILRRKGPEDLSGRYRLIVNPSGDGSSISVLTESGGPAPARVARDILSAIEERLS